MLSEECVHEEDHQLKIVLIGGPGTGKTFTITEAKSLAHPRPFICCAAFGSAAACLPGGSTICQVFGFNAQRKRNYAGSTELQSLSEKFMPTVFDRLHQQFVKNKGILIMDEVSLLTAVNLCHVSKTLQDLVKKTKNFPKDPLLKAVNRYHSSAKLHEENVFGGVDTVLAGDWYQIPGIGMGLPEAIMHLIMNQDVHYGKINRKSLEGARIFLQFTKIELSKNVRSGGDESHSAKIASIRDFNNRYPITDEFLLHLKNKVLTSNDLQLDSTWLTDGLFLTSSNETRKALNYSLAREYCKLRNEVLIMYPLDIQTTYDDSDFSGICSTQEELRMELRKKYPDLWGYYVKSGPAVLTRNFKPELKLANGSQVYFHSMIFDRKSAKYAETERIIMQAQPGCVVQIPMAPTYIVVEAPDIEVKNFKLDDKEMLEKGKAEATRMGFTCYAIPVYGSQSEHISNPIIKEKILKTVQFKEPRLEMLYSCTFHKAQG